MYNRTHIILNSQPGVMNAIRRDDFGEIHLGRSRLTSAGNRPSLRFWAAPKPFIKGDI